MQTPSAKKYVVVIVENKVGSQEVTSYEGWKFVSAIPCAISSKWETHGRIALIFEQEK